MSQFESNVEILVSPALPGAAHVSMKTALKRGVIVAASLAMGSFVFVGARTLWLEWALLKDAVGGAQASALVGFRDIAPTVSYAQPPRDLIRQEGNETLLWSRWENGVGHHWFHFRRGDIDPAHLRHPESTMISRAIDHPVVESNGGTIWKRIPQECAVVGHRLVGLRCAYPVIVLGKVQVINDVVEDHPYLIVANLFAPDQEAYSIFESELDGHRLTMAASGYFHDGKPLLYDRGTESLWLEEADHLKAAAGKHKGARLVRVARPAPVSWKSWLAQSKDCRLLVGADRSQATPRE
jgi:Protein of unknown function (DUF3179)